MQRLHLHFTTLLCASALVLAGCSDKNDGSGGGDATDGEDGTGSSDGDADADGTGSADDDGTSSASGSGGETGNDGGDGTGADTSAGPGTDGGTSDSDTGGTTSDDSGTTGGAVVCEDLGRDACMAADGCMAFIGRPVGRSSNGGFCLEEAEFLACVDAEPCMDRPHFACMGGGAGNMPDAWWIPDSCHPDGYTDCPFDPGGPGGVPDC